MESFCCCLWQRILLTGLLVPPGFILRVTTCDRSTVVSGFVVPSGFRVMIVSSIRVRASAL